MERECGYADALHRGTLAMVQKNYDSAKRLLMRAHGLGHASKADHLRAHRALIRLAVARRHPVESLSQCALFALAWMFERDPRSYARSDGAQKKRDQPAAG